MSATRREFIKELGVERGGGVVADIARGTAAQAGALPRAASGRRKVIYDQDAAGPFGTDILGTLMILQAENVDLLGITLVTGDAWMKQEMAYTLRLLEMMGRADVPVYPGAEFPMLNTKEEWLLRLQLSADTDSIRGWAHSIARTADPTMWKRCPLRTTASPQFGHSRNMRRDSS